MVDERNKGGNKWDSDEDELEMYLSGGSVCLRKILEKGGKGRMEEIISQLWTEGPVF